MGDRMYATEGDSGYVARLGSGWAAGVRTGDPQPGEGWGAAPPPRPPADDATAGVARRLQGRLDRHLWLLDRVAAEPRPESPDLAELLDTAARMRRDTESLLLLCGHEPGVRATGPRGLDELMGDAAALAEEPRLVEVRSAPRATVGSAAAVEFLHVLAELVDDTTAAHPGARLELVGRVESGGVTVDVVVDGARPDPEGAGRAAVADRLAQQSRYGIALHRPLGGPPPSGSGLVASVHCPPSEVTVEEVPEPPTSRTGGRPQYNGARASLGLEFDGGGFDGGGFGGGLGGALDDGLDRPVSGWSDALSGPLPGGGAGPVNGFGTGPINRFGNGTGNGFDNGSTGNGFGNGTGNGFGHPEPDTTSAPPYSPSQSSQVDELFGPLLDLPLEPIDDRYATPIFEAIASAWFKEGEAEPAGDTPLGPLDWETPQDSEWREAAARAARSEPPATTSTGLPRRRPGDQLVPPPRSQSGSPGAGPAERVPDRVRDRLSTYQRGLRQGRHRAPGEEFQELHEPEDW